MIISDSDLAKDIERVRQIPMIDTLLDVLCQTTGMRFAAVARVTQDKWVACSVRDDIQFGLVPGGELPLNTTICNEIRDNHQAVIIDHVAENQAFCQHPTPLLYGFQSYISFPILLKTGEFFGTLCAIDPNPAQLNNAKTIGLFTLFADLIAFHLQQVNLLEDSQHTVAQQVLDRQQLEGSEARFRNLIQESPVATCLFKGPDMVIDLANEAMIQVWGKGDAVLGKPLIVALPELADQPFLPLLDHLYATGQTYEAKTGRADLVIDGNLKIFYFNYAFKPLRDDTGNVYAILETAIDVTEQVVTRQQLVEAEAGLRVAIDLAKLGTWSIDVATNGLTYSDRLIEWFGYDPAAQAYDQVIPILEPGDQERVAAAVAWALNPQSGGVYDEIYTVIHPTTGQKRVLHARGKTVFDVTGKPVRLNGTAQDITSQQEVQLALEQQVQERTRELSLVNEELASTMEELAATNEELEVTNEEILASNEEYIALNNQLQTVNSLLTRSNDNLQRFAYVASHDLQEPLRKIQQFGNLLKTEHAAALGNELVYLERMQDAASRMSTLIRDLLSYSRISAQSEVREPVPLNQVVDQVLTDLELVIEETNAQISVDSLPTILGDASQLGQLFQNLLSNALKFRRPDVSPCVRVQARLVLQTDLPANVKPIRPAQFYHQLDVVDNGIGFEEQYAQRIFEAFQRLHRKHEYVGTGIGLSIGERVVASHGGAITASSQPGQGATFSVYLPV